MFFFGMLGLNSKTVKNAFLLEI